eukprot:6181908-Prymnesium_polylepis.1
MLHSAGSGSPRASHNGTCARLHNISDTWVPQRVIVIVGAQPIDVPEEGLVGAEHEAHEDARRLAVRLQLAFMPDARELRAQRVRSRLQRRPALRLLLRLVHEERRDVARRLREVAVP